jgi:hypothetical protein
MKKRLTSFTALSCVLALLCSCASPPPQTTATDVTWTKVADGHYQSRPVDSSEQESGDLLRGGNAVEKTYGVFVGAMQGVGAVFAVVPAIVLFYPIEFAFGQRNGL